MRIIPSASMLPLVTLTATMASAADYATRDLGAWIISASSDRQGCFLTRTYPKERGTTLQLGLDVDGSNRLTLLNPNWSITAREQFQLDFRLSNSAFPNHRAIGIVSQGKRGFVTKFGSTFPRSFGASDYFKVYRGSVTVEEVKLDGSGAAVAELRNCVDHLRAPATSKSARDSRDHIPLDPFASNAGRDNKK